MADKYRLDPQLQPFEKLGFENLRITPLKLSLFNAAATISCALTPRDKKTMRDVVTVHGYQNGLVPLMIYTPLHLPNNAPCLLYLHGSGFMSRDFGYMHRVVSRYAREARCRVLLVRYRLAPRYPFPAAPEDCYAALVWAYKHAVELGIDRNRIAVGGDSAGGALAAALTHMTRDRGGPKICFQMLLYPVTDIAMNTPSMREFTDTPGWNANLNRQMWDIYLKNGDFGMLPYASPMSATDFSALPDAFVEVEEYDCLRDEGLAYAARLEENGCTVAVRQMQGTFHAFDVLQETRVAKEAMKTRIHALNEAFWKE